MTVAALALMLAPVAMAEDFFWEEDFEACTQGDLYNGDWLPEGWSNSGAWMMNVQPSSWVASTAHSGDHMLAFGLAVAGQEGWAKTSPIEMRGGVEYSVSFWMKRDEGQYPGRQSQYPAVEVRIGNGDVAQMAVAYTTDQEVTPWKEYTFTYTPAEDGALHLALYCQADAAAKPGAIYVDDITIEASLPEVPVEPEVEVAELPYFQTFDNLDNDYDGVTELIPHGWLSTGTIPFLTASDPDLPAVTGSYYMVLPDSDTTRDEQVFSPLFAMAGGESYHVSFYYYMPGPAYSETLGQLTLSAHTSQSAASQVGAPLWISAAERYTEWTKAEAVFAAPADGVYCLSLQPTPGEAFAGPLYVEDFMVTLEGGAVRPVADFAIGGLWDIMDNTTAVAFRGQPWRLYNRSSLAQSYAWSVEGPETFNSEEVNPVIYFTQGGAYRITLTARNGEYERTAARNVNINLIEEDTEQMGLANYAPQDEHRVIAPQIPTYDTDVYDYISGPNHHYLSIAERVSLPTQQKAQISTLNLYLADYTRRMGVKLPDDTEENRDYPVTLAIYGDAGGRPDMERVFYSRRTKVTQLFGETGFAHEGVNPLDIVFEEPVEVEGTYYVAVLFDESFPLEAYDANIPRSTFALGTVRHHSNATTLYGYDAAEGAWRPVDYWGNQGRGHGLYMVQWMTVSAPAADQPNDRPNEDEVGGLVAVDGEGKAVFAARITAEGVLQVSGAASGEQLRVLDMQGRTVLRFAGSHADASSLPAGAYVVAGGSGATKVLKRR